MSAPDRDPVVPGIAVIDLEATGPDVAAELGLDKRPGAMTTLGFIADKGGEVGWNWDGGIDPKTGLWKPLSREARELVTDLINMELVKEREYVTHAAQAQGTGKLTLVLTDKGRNVVEKMRARKIVGRSPRPITVSELAELARLPATNGSGSENG